MPMQLNYFFCSVYFLECVVKITGLGWRMYWKDTWNKVRTAAGARL